MTTSPIMTTGRMSSREMARLRRLHAIRHALGRAGIHAMAILAALVSAAPFLWSLVLSFRRSDGLGDSANNPFRFHRSATSDHVLLLLRDTPYLTFVANTLIVGGLVVVITAVLAMPAAYSLARLNRPWSTRTGIGILLVYLVPPSLLFLPLTRIVTMLGLKDTPWSMVVVYPTITVPVSVWLLTGFLKAVPRDIEEQAMIDGYSRLGAFTRVVVPHIVPGVVAVAAFGFVLTAGEFLYALTFVSPSAEMTVSAGVPTRLTGDDVLYQVSYQQPLQAAAVTLAVPIAFVSGLFLDRFITGLAHRGAETQPG